MKKRENTQERPRRLKRKLLAALAMLLVSTIMLGTSSYAWFVLSVAPEVTGITTSVGSNGSLEIALLNTETRQDLSAIRTGTNSSMSKNDATIANITWGNLLDMSSADYGLGTLMLMPSRLSVNGNTVNDGILEVPTYGFDGRIESLDSSALTAIYSKDDLVFSKVSDVQDYGVRAVGLSSMVSVQAAALGSAKASVTGHRQSANSTAASTFAKNTDGLIGIILNKNLDSNFTDTHKATLQSLINGLEDSVRYIDLAIRQAFVAYAAVELEDADEFTLARAYIVNENNSLADIISEMGNHVGNASLLVSMSTWSSRVVSMQQQLTTAEGILNTLTDNDYTWEEIRSAMDYIMNVDSVYINDESFDDVDTDTLLAGNEVELTLAPGSGVPADIADFADDFQSSAAYMGKDIVITTETLQDPVYLATLAENVSGLTVDSDLPAGTKMELESTYGYVLDLAFRTNAANSDLLLQTEGTQRVYTDSTTAATQGGGSYMVFNSNDDSFTTTKIAKLMDAIRVAFIDDTGNILAVAKPNVTNRYVDDEGVKAPLYLYEYSFVTDATADNLGAIVIGERRATDNAITSLDQGTAKAVSVVVWLDGDEVDNSFVSATEKESLVGSINLQFASSADLVPAEYENNYATNKADLAEQVESNKATYEAGQGMYSTVSWDDFEAAYEYAKNVNENSEATQGQIYNASKNLSRTAANLESLSVETLQEKINELRKEVGQTSTVARIIEETDGGYTLVTNFDGDQYDAAADIIFSVDHTKNYHNADNETPVLKYTEESWLALANAIYAAEAAIKMEELDYDRVDELLTSLDEAKEALAPAFIYVAYEYNGDLYYWRYDAWQTNEKLEAKEEGVEGQAEGDEEEEELVLDTYGTWYDSEFNLIVKEKTILDLDAHAVPAQIATIDNLDVAANESSTIGNFAPTGASMVITPYVNLSSKIYSALEKEEIRSVVWASPDGFTINEDFTQTEEPGEEPAFDPDVYEPEYVVKNPAYVLSLSLAQPGKATLEATVLTKSGIIYTAKKEIEVYNPIEGVEFEAGTTTVQAGQSIDLTAAVFGDNYTEEVVSWTWASGSTATATVSGTNTSATVKGVKEGTCVITVTVTTKQGNEYSEYVTVTVTPDPNAEVEEPAEG